MRADYRWIEKVIQDVPGLFGVCQPRRYVPPHGYTNPSFHAASMACDLAMEPMMEHLNKTEVDVAMINWTLIENQVPIYFVGHDYISALAMSDPPIDMRLDEIRWPFDAIVFMLPEQFQRDYFKRPLPFVRVAKSLIAVHEAPMAIQCFEFNGFPIGHRKLGLGFGDNTLPSGAKPSDSRYGYFASGEVLFGDKPVHYSSSWPMNATIGDGMQAGQMKFDDYTEGNASGWIDQSLVPTREEDIDIACKIFKVTVWLLLGMMSTPQHIEPGSVLRQARIKRGVVVKDALWSPNFLGRTYTWRRESLGGEHASPRMHRRRGHWTHQPYGPKMSLRKLIWLEPMWISA